MQTGHITRALLAPLIAVTLALAGCGGGSSSTQSNVAAPVATAPNVGGAAKGILKNASVVIKEWQNGDWAQIGTTTTDANGQFGLDLSGITNPILVVVTTTAQTTMTCDSADACSGDFGQDISLPANFTLEAILPSGADATNFSVTPLTTLAAEWVKQMSGNVAVNAVSVNQALARVADLFGLDSTFYAQLPVDITNSSAVTGAASIKAELLSAAFFTQNGSIQDNLTTFINAFIGNGGQLPLNTNAAVTNTLNTLIARANEVASIVANSVLGNPTQLNDVIASLNGAITRWGTSATITSAQGSNAYSQFTDDEKTKFDQSKALFTQMATYLNQAGIDENGTFVSNQARQVNWLYEDPNARADTASLIGSIGNIAIQTALVTLMVPQHQADLATLPVGNCASLSSVIANSIGQICKSGENTYYLTFVGTVTTANGHSQTVNAKITIPTLTADALNSGTLQLPFTLSGTGGDQASMSNPTVSGNLSGSLQVNISKPNAAQPGLLDLLATLVTGTTSTTTINPIQALLNTSISVQISNVNGQLTRESASTDTDLVQQGQSFTVALDASLNVNLSAISVTMLNVNGNLVPQFAFNDQTLLTGTITDGSFTTPRGDYLKALTADNSDGFCDYQGSTRLPLKVVVAGTSTAEGCFAAKLLELPEMDVVFQGQLTGAMNVVNQVISGFLGSSALIPTVIDGLDLSALGLSGSAKLLVKDETAVGYQTYNFTLDRNHVTATQQENNNRIDIYFSSLNGGYLTNGGVWVGSFRIDWLNLALNVQLADGTNQTFAMGSIFGALDPQLISLITESLGQIDFSMLTGSGS